MTRPVSPPPGCNSKVKNLFCFKLDAMSVLEALATTILILLTFSIVLAHQWEPQSMGPPHPSGTPHWHPWAPPGHPWLPLVPMGARGGRGVHVPNPATQKPIITIIQLLFQFFPGVRNSGWGGRGIAPGIRALPRVLKHV